MTVDIQLKIGRAVITVDHGLHRYIYDLTLDENSIIELSSAMDRHAEEDSLPLTQRHADLAWKIFDRFVRNHPAQFREALRS